MISGSGADGPIGAGGLEGIRQTVASGNPEFYRHLALYLQVLRNVLPGRLQQACFHLTTQVHAQRYLKLSTSRRRELHRLIQERVRQCCCLLTVEQLAALAKSLEQNHQEQQGRRQRKLLQRLLSQSSGDADASGDAAAADQDDPPEEDPPGPPPPGSVHLGLSAPIDPAALGWSVPPHWSAAASVWDPEASADGDQDDLEDALEFEEPDFTEAGDPPAGSDHPDDASGPQGDRAVLEEQEDSEAAALMAALMQGLLGHGDMTAESDGAEENDREADAPQATGPVEARLAPASGAPASMGLQAALIDVSGGAFGATQGSLPHQRDGRRADPSASASPWDDASLPQDPIQLLRWLEGVEQALARRLRDLSHAINSDLLRLGLSRGLLPVSLLEAVIKGQIETLSSPANVLRLQLPFGLSPGAPPLQAIAILLRPADLEMEEPRLRTCRRRIHQHRQQLRKMAETYRRLQRRLRAHDAERLWLQDIQASHEGGS